MKIKTDNEFLSKAVDLVVGYTDEHLDKKEACQMLGLRTHEGKRFENFFAIVQNEAANENAVFFLDCGEGHEFEEDELCGEDLSGWLVPKEESEAFRELFESGDDLEVWSDCICFAVWSKKENNISIRFQMF